MITILLVIVILAIIGHILEIDFSDIKKRFKNKEKSSPFGYENNKIGDDNV